MILVVAAIRFARDPEPALALMAGVTLALVFIGIHNAWDTITYVAAGEKPAPEETRRPGRRKRH